MPRVRCVHVWLYICFFIFWKHVRKLFDLFLVPPLSAAVPQLSALLSGSFFLVLCSCLVFVFNFCICLSCSVFRCFSCFLVFCFFCIFWGGGRPPRKSLHCSFCQHIFNCPGRGYLVGVWAPLLARKLIFQCAAALDPVSGFVIPGWAGGVARSLEN